MTHHQVLRWTVEVDDRPHDIGPGSILHVAARSHTTVDVWTLENPENVAPSRTVQVFATGQNLPPDATGHLGSTVIEPFVWHLFQLAPADFKTLP